MEVTANSYCRKSNRHTFITGGSQTHIDRSGKIVIKSLRAKIALSEEQLTNIFFWVKTKKKREDKSNDE